MEKTIKKKQKKIKETDNLTPCSKVTVYTCPRFLQPINCCRLNIDIFISFRNGISFFQNQQNYKKIVKAEFNTKKKSFDSLEFHLESYNKDITPVDLIKDRLSSLNDVHAKNLADILEVFNNNSPFWEFKNKNEYLNSKEYLDYLKRIEVAKMKRIGKPYIIFQGRYDYEKKGLELYKETFSKKMIEIIYQDNIKELYEDFLENCNQIPFLGFFFNDNDYEYWYSVMNSAFLGKKMPIKKLMISITKNGDKVSKALIKHFVIRCYDPMDPEKICEVALIQQMEMLRNEENEITEKESYSINSIVNSDLFMDEVKKVNEKIFTEYFQEKK